MTYRPVSLEMEPARAWTHGRITAFVKRHALAWELSTAVLTVAYVVLAFFQDRGSSGLVTTIAGRTSAGAANGKRSTTSFSHPAGLTVGPGGYIYVADVGNNKIRMISPEGLVTNFAGSGSRGATNGRDTIASFFRPYGVAADKSGNIYVADYLNNIIRKISF